MKVKFTQHARDCLKKIYEYYKDKSQSRYGRKTRANIIQKTLQLENFPLLVPIEENLSALNLGHRYLVEGNYKIIYRMIDDDIWITDIFDTRQNPEKMTGQ